MSDNDVKVLLKICRKIAAANGFNKQCSIPSNANRKNTGSISEQVALMQSKLFEALEIMKQIDDTNNSIDEQFENAVIRIIDLQSEIVKKYGTNKKH